MNSKIKKAGTWASVAGSLGLAGFQFAENQSLITQNELLVKTVTEQSKRYSERITQLVRDCATRSD